MKLEKYFISLFIFLGVFSSSQAALATQFTYASSALLFKQGYLGGEPDDTVGSYDSFSPSFNVSFQGDTNGLITTFSAGNLTINNDELPYHLNNVPASSNSSITLNNDGSIAAWHFSLALEQITPQIGENAPERNTWWVESSHGSNTCNCDWYKNEYDLYITRPYGSFAYVNTLGFLYGGENTPGNWSLTNTDVPEPVNYLLLLSGLAMVGLTRLRKR